MKKIVVFSLIVLFLSCADSETKISGPSATAQIVIESFYEKDEETLKANSTPQAYSNGHAHLDEQKCCLLLLNIG